MRIADAHGAEAYAEVQILQRRTSLPVKEAEHGDMIEPGHIDVAPDVGRG